MTLTSIPILTPEYLAGYFDSSGSVVFTQSTSRDNVKYYLQVCINGNSEEFLNQIRSYVGYGSVQQRADYCYRYYTSTRSAFNLANLLVDKTLIKNSALRLGIQFFTDMSKIGKEIRASGRYSRPDLANLRVKQFNTFNYYKDKLFHVG